MIEQLVKGVLPEKNAYNLMNDRSKGKSRIYKVATEIKKGKG